MFYYFSSIFDIGSSLTTSEGVWGTILKALRSLFFSINELIYKFVAILYNMFEALCNARLLSSGEFGILAEKIGVLLGIIMLFKVMLEFIQLLVDPDKITDNQKGAVAIIKRVIIVLVMLGVSSFAFDALYFIQSYILDNQILYGFLLPVNDKKINTDAFGDVLSARVFGGFYTVNEAILAADEEDALQCVDYRNLLLNNIAQDRDYSVGTFCLNAYGSYTMSNNGVSRDYFIMDYNFLLQTLTGVILVYLLVSYVIQVGVRVIQLTVLQIISPAAIVGYLSPKQDNMFSKWTKLYFATYIDAFIRMLVIYFVVYICSVLLETLDSGVSEFWNSIGNPTDTFTRTMFVIAMILALLTFAKKAPDLIKELIPNASGRYNPSWKNIVGLQKGVNTVAGAAIAAPIGLIGGWAGGKNLGSSLTGAVSGAFTGVFRGGHAGFGAKGFGNALTTARTDQSKANLARAQRIASGTTLDETVGDSVRGFFGVQSNYTHTDSRLSVFNNLNSLINDEDIVKDYISQRETASQALGNAQAAYDGNRSAANLAALNSARDAFYQADARVGAAKDAVFEAFSNNTSVSNITFDWTDSSGVTHSGVTERALSEIKPNASGVAALDNVQRVAGTNYKNRKAFNNERRRLQGESQTRHKNG